jgi:hypothetical protein
MREVERMLANQAPFEDVVTIIDSCLSLPGADELRASIERHRVRAYVTYQRPADEVSAVLDAFLALETDVTPRAVATLAACGQIPELAPRYLDPIIAEVDAAASADASLAGLLAHARQVRERLVQ